MTASVCWSLAHWPGASVIFAAIGSPIALAFLARYPSPAAAAGLGEKRIAAFCARQGYSGRRTAARLLARLGGAPAGMTPVTRASGKHRAVHFRWACNKRFRQAMTTFADNSRHASPWDARDIRRRPHHCQGTTRTPSASWPAPGSA